MSDISNNKLATISELQTLAREMRDGQELINDRKRDLLANMGELIALAAEQGQRCLLAKTKLHKTLRWSDWLQSHVPNLPEQEAAKYERISTEQITDVRQGLFAFLPPTEAKKIEERTPPSKWEAAWGFVEKLKKAITAEPLDKWPKTQVELTKSQLEPVAKQLWPEKFK